MASRVLLGARLVESLLLFSRCNSEEELVAVLAREAAKLGFDKFLFATLQNHLRSGQPWVSTTYSEEWQKHYVGKGYDKTDPIRRCALTTPRAFAWKDVTKALPKKSAIIFNEAEDAGLRSGIAVPFHGPRGMCAAIGYAASERGLDDAANVDALAMLSYAFFSNFACYACPRDDAAVHLTRREIDVLQWCAEGATTWQIAEKLGISDNSVEWHTRNILDKMGVSNKTAAVARALRSGLIR